MAYSELIKNFEKIRSYMRQFYVYGIKSRSQYDEKSTRSYDDERRRLESWLGDHMGFAYTPEGKHMYLSVNSRACRRNPLYKAWKAKSFTDGDITLHFLLLDILHAPTVPQTLPQIIEAVDNYLSETDAELTFDESTIRKKLKEYAALGIIRTEKQGRRVLYARAEDENIGPLSEFMDYFSEVAPCGVIGSYIADRLPRHRSSFCFKHHYITQAMDSGVLYALFDAMGQKRFICADNGGKRPARVRLVPLKIYISVQNGRQYLIAWHEKAGRLNAYRLDYLSNVKLEEFCPDFDRLRSGLVRSEAHMWGVNTRWNPERLEHVEFQVYVGPNEGYILNRLLREKRCGTVTRVDDTHYRYEADVYDSCELLPWIRTFICRITRMNFSNRTAENMFKADLQALYRMYDSEGGDGA